MANNQYVNRVDYGNSTLIDISNTTVEAGDVLAGKTFYLKSGAPATGSILSKAATTYTPTTTNQTISANQYLSGVQTILGDANLIAENIKKDVSIFGVVGTHEGGGNGTIIIEDSLDANGGTIRNITTTGQTIYLDTLTVTNNGVYTPNTNHYYSTVTVEVEGSAPANLQEKTNIDPSTASQTITADSGYDGLSSVQINAMPTLTLPTSAASSATNGYTSKATISRSTSDQYINIPTGYNSTGAYYKIDAVANGTATAPASISGTSATISTSSNTLTLTKTVSVTPSVTAGYISSGTAGNSSVSLTASVAVNPTPTASGATVTIPAGYYSTDTSKSVTTMTLPTSASASATSGYTSKATISRSTSAQYINIPPGYNSAGGYYTISAVPNMTLPTATTSSATSGYTSKATISRSTSDQYINIPTGYNTAGAYYKINAVANGSATGPSSLSGSSATLSTGTNTLTLTKTGVTTTPTVSAGYVSSATASTATVTLTASVTTKAAATITPGTSDQTIASGTYLTGTQTISGDADLIASNIKTDVAIFGVTGTYTADATAAADEILSGETAYVNGTKLTGSLVITTVYVGSAVPSASTGINGDIYIKS